MLNQIEQAIPDLSRAEKSVAAWVLGHPRQAAAATVADVAGAAGTSEPTVIRFCRSIGLRGFRDLKLRLAEAMSRPGSYLHRDVNPDDSSGDAVAKVIDRSIRAMVDIRGLISTLPLDEAVTAMSGARQLVFIGVGASGHVARDACHKFFRLGIPCATATDAPMILQITAIADPSDVFVVISHTGRRPDIAKAARVARDRGATVIAFTDRESEIAAASSIVFGSEVAEDTNVYTPMSSRLAQLALLDGLQVALAVRLGEDADANLKATKAALLNL